MINHKAMKEKNNLRLHEVTKIRERYIYDILVEAGILVQDYDGDITIDDGRYMGRYRVQVVRGETK